MYKHRFSGLTPALLTVALAALLPAAASGQVRQVVSNQLAISEREASIHLEFADQGRLDIEFRDGEVFVGDAVVGTYDRRDELWKLILLTHRWTEREDQPGRIEGINAFLPTATIVVNAQIGTGVRIETFDVQPTRLRRGQIRKLTDIGRLSRRGH